MKRSVFLFVLILAALCGPLLGQTVTATLVGTVTDSTGALVPGATVTAVHTATNTVRTTRTDEAGNYAFPLLRTGQYEVTAEQNGFKRTRVRPFELQVDQTARVDILLEVGTVAESLQVTAAAPLVSSETSSVGQVITTQQIQNLPLNGRSFFSLVLLAPGTTPTMPRSFIAGSHAIPGELSVPAFYVGGAREKSNGYLIDGVDAQDPHFQTPSLYPSVDAIQEFKLQTNAYSAEYGRYAAQVNVATRSGSNDLHGSAYEFFRNDALDATNFFANLNGLKKPPLRYNQFGGTLSGPLSIPRVYSGKDRTFYFLSYESTRIRQGNTGQATVPTVAQRAGDFSTLGVRANRPIYDPATTRSGPNGTVIRDPFPGNLIPADRITPFGRGILALYPLPNADTLTGNNYIVPLKDVSDKDQFMGRVDHRFDDRNSLFYRYSLTTGNLTNRNAIPGAGSMTDMTTNNMALSYVHLFSGSLLNELRLGYNRPKYFVLQEGANGPNLTANLGIRNLVDVPIAYGVPTISISNISTIDAGTFSPSTQLTNIYHLIDHVSWTRGAHAFKFGADLRKLNYNDRTERQPRGSFSFTGGLTANPSQASSTGVALADLLLGLPLTAAGSTTSLAGAFNGYNYGFFFQDDWKITRRVTLNLGLRYDLNTRITENLNHMTLFDRSYPGGRLLLAGTNQAYLPGAGYTNGPDTPRGLLPTDLNNWGPRIGIAIRPFNDNRTAIRLGYGIFYDLVELQDLRTWTRNPPFGSIISLQSDQNGNSDSAAVLRASELFPPQGTAGARPDIYTAGGKYPDPYYQQWNVNVQRELFGQMLVEVGYAGSKGTRLARRLTGNQAFLDADPNRPTPILNRRPYPLFGNTVRITDNDGNSTYHALLMKAEKRFAHGLSFLFAYTYSKTIDSGSLIDDQPRDTYNGTLDKGRAAFDIRHRPVFSATYELPFGRGHAYLTHGVPAILLGGWQLNTITSFRSGFPFSVAAQGDVCNCGASGQLAQQVGDPYSGFTQSRLQWFNVAAFAQPARGTFGNTGRNIVDGPGEASVNLSVFRNTKLSERWGLQFRAEVFNLLNHTNFGQPGNQVGSPSFGLIQSASPARAIQLALKTSF